MAALTGPQKLAIVLALACFDSPSEVQRQLKDDFELEASLQQIRYYDPTTPQGSRELAPELRETFRRTREAFLKGREGIAIGHKVVRLRRLERLFHARRVQNSPELQLKVLEQAAKEEGEVYSNRSTVTVLRQMARELEELSDEELLQQLGSGERPETAAGAGGAA